MQLNLNSSKQVITEHLHVTHVCTGFIHLHTDVNVLQEVVLEEV